MARPKTLLTAARAARVARQYFGATPKVTSSEASKYQFGYGHRDLVVEQRAMGTVTLTEDGETDTFFLPPIGPVDFKQTCENP